MLKGTNFESKAFYGFGHFELTQKFCLHESTYEA